MEMRKLGRSDMDVTVLGLGCNNFGWFIDKQKSQAVIATALDEGVNFFDTANNYGMPAGESERILGETLGSCRQSVLIASKFGDQVGESAEDRGAAPDYIRMAVERSLKNLGTDYIDLYQLHYPDPGVPIEETLRVLEELVNTGKVRRIGCANHSASQTAQALDASAQLGAPEFVSCQSEYSLVAREIEADFVPLLIARKIGFLPYFPLANGLLTGKYRGQSTTFGRLQTVKNFAFFERFLTKERFDKVEALARLAEAGEITLLELALSWLRQQPHVTSVIAGATSPEQVKANARAISQIIPVEMRARIDDIR
jgi:aryl-alcohol dehydrogenase-like predicted oxidoreductase